MKNSEAISLVQDAFGSDYSASAFERFISNLLKGQYTPLDKRRDGHYVREAFRSFVQGYRILGAYQDAEGTSLDILEVTLQRDSSLDRAKTKDEINEAWKEVHRPKIGRKARISNQAVTVFEPSPSENRIVRNDQALKDARKDI